MASQNESGDAKSVSRRSMLRLAGGVAAAGTAAVIIPRAVSTLAAPPPPPAGAPPPAAAPPPPASPDGLANSSLLCGVVPTHFGRMFPRLPAASWSLADLTLLAAAVVADEETDPTPEDQIDDEENTDIDAGFTYVGQFIDHDLDFDNRPDDLVTPVDPTTLANSRTPAFDLDNIYGSGPTVSPQLYEPDHLHMKLGSLLTGSSDQNAHDLPRDAAGTALIGDPRNDENKIVASLHSIFLRFHNQTVDRLHREHTAWGPDRLFKEAQQFVRLHYQMAVLSDFLPAIVGREMVRSILPNFPQDRSSRLRFFNPCATGVPVEFSVAAYRFGHSMVRAIYRINETVPRLPVFTASFNPTESLVGFQPSPSHFAVDWKFFFPIETPRKIGKPQFSYKFDNSLVFPLSLLPLPATGAGPASLAKRNLMRAVQIGLPSGQSVARAMGERPLRDDQILIGKATADPADAQAITAISPAFAGKCPLWNYVLAEATNEAYSIRDGKIVGAQRAAFRHGPVGGRIIAETFIGLMAADRDSVLNTSTFQPDRGLTDNNGRVTFKEIIKRVTAG